MTIKEEGDRASFDLWKQLEEDCPEYVASLERDEYACLEIDSAFLGFVGVYRRLAEIIPEGHTIYDFGCSYAPQAWYFRNHKRYIGISPGSEISPRLHLPNTTYMLMTAVESLKLFEIKPNSFAIVNYVDDHTVAPLVKSRFLNCFTFYPSAESGTIF